MKRFAGKCMRSMALWINGNGKRLLPVFWVNVGVEKFYGGAEVGI
jgi:hypothetical protein